MNEFWGLDDFAKTNGLAMRIGNFDADGGFSRNSLDEQGFGFKSEAKIIGQPSNAAVLDSGFRLEFEGGHHRSGIDLGDVALDVEFLGFLLDVPGAIF